MTEYRAGFISSIIERSDQILRRNQYDVTRLLLLLSVGYGMVLERLKFHSSDTEQNVSNSVVHSKFEKKLSKYTCEKNLTLGSQDYFENFIDNEEWHMFSIAGYTRKYSIDELWSSLDACQKINRSELKFSTLFSCVRNSLAHGGVHPLSPRQSNSHLSSRFVPISRGVGSQEKIDKIIFVSKNTDAENNAIGFIVMVMSVEAAHSFWQDWRSLLMKNEYFDYLDLDNVA